MMSDTPPMATKTKRAKRAKGKVAKKVARKPSFDEQIKGARASYLDFLKTADPDAPELRR